MNESTVSLDEVPTVALIGALARIWQKIRLLHPDVPSVALLPAPAPRGRADVLGHFAPLRWCPREEGGDLVHEVVVVAEHLSRGVEETLSTLLHEAAHAMNFHRGIFDCSATSQYHNRHFRDAAIELGLDVAKVRNYGFALTSLPELTARRYGEELDNLEAVLLHRRMPVELGSSSPANEDDDAEAISNDDEKKTSTSRSRKAVCACPFIIRASKKVLSSTVIRCENCGEPFALE